MAYGHGNTWFGASARQEVENKLRFELPGVYVALALT
jgi:hypothetical protein